MIVAVLFSMSITYVTEKVSDPSPILIYTLSALYMYVITSTFTIGYVISRSLAENDLKRKAYFIPILTTVMCAVVLIVVPFIDHSDVMLGILISDNRLYYIINAIQMVNMALGGYYIIRYYKNFNIYMLLVSLLAYIFLVVTIVVYINTNNFQLISFLVSLYLLLSYLILLSSAKEFDKDISQISEKRLNKMIVSAIVEDKFTFVLGPTYSQQLGKYVAAESELRLVDKNFGPIPSEKIREAAMKDGYIYRIEKIILTKTIDYIARNADVMNQINWIVIRLSNSTLESDKRVDNLIRMVISRKIPTRQIAFEIGLETDENRVELAKKGIRKLQSMGFKVVFDFVHSPDRSFKVLVQHSDCYIVIDDEILERLYSKGEGEVSPYLVKDFMEVLELKFIVSCITCERQKNLACAHQMDLMSGDFLSEHLYENQFNEFISWNNKVSD